MAFRRFLFGVMAVALPLLVMTLLAAGCGGEEGTPIDLAQREALPTASPSQAGVEPLRIAVAGMITPREGYDYYQNFLLYIGEQVGRPVRSVFMDDYTETNRQLREGLTDVGLVCSGPYVDGRRDFGLQILVVPQVNGVPAYFSYLIVPEESAATTLGGLRGKAFAFTDPASNTGKVYPTYLLAKMGTTPERFFSRTIFTASHDKSIAAVAEHLVDGAAVDSLIYDYLAKTKPELIRETRIIHTSPPFGIPPVTIRAGLDPALVEQLRQAFLSAHQNERGKALLARMMIEKFVTAEDSLYDSIREMKRFNERSAAAAPTPSPR
jgi:phosphonate transport system substrate-binding protein